MGYFKNFHTRLILPKCNRQWYYLLLTICVILIPFFSFAISPPQIDTLVFTKRSGSAVYFLQGESVKCVTSTNPRQLVKGVIYAIGDDHVMIDTTAVPFDNIYSLESRPGKADDVLTALLVLTPVLLLFGGLAQFASGLGDSGNTGQQFTEIVGWSFLGVVFLKIVRAVTKKKIKNVQKRYTVRRGAGRA